MDEQGQFYSPFQFPDPRQQRIYEELYEVVGPGPAAFFRDACWLMENANALNTTAHLVAHLLREIESAICSLFEPYLQNKKDKEIEELISRHLDIFNESKAQDLCSFIYSPSRIIGNRDQIKNGLKAIIKFFNIPNESPETQVLLQLVDVATKSHHEQIKEILCFLDIKEESVAQVWFNLSENLHKIAHRSGLDSPRPPEEVCDLWKEALLLLDVLMKDMREHFLEWIAVLDELLAKPQPTNKDVKRLTQHIPNNTTIWRYFFERLEKPEWLELLCKEGGFRNPPHAERDEQQGVIRFSSWPQARYLARMAPYKPELVARIIREMADTDNAGVHLDLIEVALALPANYAAEVLEKAKKWAGSPYLLSPEKLGELMAYWAKGGKTYEALELAGVLLDVLPDPTRPLNEKEEVYKFPPEPKARFRTWEYGRILTQHYPKVAEAAGLPALELLCNLLEKAIQFSRRQDGKVDAEDYSYIWRPAIEDRSYDFSDIKDALVSSVKDTAELLMRKVPVAQIVDILEGRRWKIFQRIALHLLRVFASQTGEFVATRLTDRRLFDDELYVEHEYALLIRECFGLLSPEHRKTILDWIGAGLDVDVFKHSREKETGSPPSEEEVTGYRENWQLQRLSWIGEEALPDEWKERYRSLVKKYGEPESPESLVCQSEGEWIGPRSPKNAQELREMPVESIIEFLKTWQPPERPFGEPSPEGLGRILSSVVSEDPGLFAGEAERFQGLDPTYVRFLLSGFQESLKQGKSFDWEPVLRLCLWVVNQPREIKGRKVRRLGADPDWGWTRKEIARLLFKGFENGAGCISFDLRRNVWDVLAPLTNDPDPTPEYEAKYGGSNMDPATLSLNTTRGVAMNAAVGYALWVHHHLEERENAEKSLRQGFTTMPEVRAVLDEHLDRSRESSLAVRAVYGWRFPQLALLDFEWAKEHAALIFPLGEEDQAYFQAAWNPYMTYCKCYDNVFDLLRPQYLYAVQRVGSQKTPSPSFRDPDKRLAEHLMVFYWRGKLNLDDPLMTTFWEKAPDELRAYALSFTGRSLIRTTTPIPQEILARLLRLWEASLSVAKESPVNHQKEMAAFGWWFVSGKFDIEWAITQLIEALKISGTIDSEDLLLERLAEMANDFPERVLESLDAWAKGCREGLEIYAVRDHIRKILAMSLQNPHLRLRTERLISYLASRSFMEFRDLLS